jgi:hypothetical protein
MQAFFGLNYEGVIENMGTGDRSAKSGDRKPETGDGKRNCLEV